MRLPARVAVILALLVPCVLGDAGVTAEGEGPLSVRVEPVPPEAAVGEPLALEVVVSGAGAEKVSLQATLISPGMEGVPIAFTGGGEGVWTGRFVPAEPGSYELSVLARAPHGGGEATARQAGTFYVRRAQGIRIENGLDRVEIAGLYPGDEAEFAVRPQFLYARGATIRAEVGQLRGQDGSRIDPTAVKLSPEALGRQDLPAAFRVELNVPMDQAPGGYEGTLRLWSEYDRCDVPVSVPVLAPGLQARPERLDLGRIQRGLSGGKSLSVSLEGGRQPVRVTLQPWLARDGREGPGFYVEGLTRSFMLTGGGAETIEVSVRAPQNAAAGLYQSVLLIETPLRRVSVPVSAHVVRPPLSVQALMSIFLAAAVLLLLALCLWELYAYLRGVRSSPMRRYLAASALIHALALLISTLLYVGREPVREEQRIAVRAVRISGEGGPAGLASEELAGFLEDIARVQEQARELEVAMADNQVEAQQKEAAETNEPSQKAVEIDLERPEHEPVAEAVAGETEVAETQAPDHQDPAVEPSAVTEKRIEEAELNAASEVDVAALESEDAASKAAARAEAAEVGVLDLDAEKAEVDLLAEVAEATSEPPSLAEAAPSESPEVPVEEVHGKVAEADAHPSESPQVELAAAEAGHDGPRQAAEASAASDLAALDLAMPRQGMDVVAAADEVVPELPALAADVPAETPEVLAQEVRGKLAAEHGQPGGAVEVDVGMAEAGEAGSKGAARSEGAEDVAPRSHVVPGAEAIAIAEAVDVVPRLSHVAPGGPRAAPDVVAPGVQVKIGSEKQPAAEVRQVDVAEMTAGRPDVKTAVAPGDAGSVSSGQVSLAARTAQPATELDWGRSLTLQTADFAAPAESLSAGVPTLAVKRAAAASGAGTERSFELSRARADAGGSKGSVGAAAAVSISVQRTGLPRAGATVRPEAYRVASGAAPSLTPQQEAPEVASAVAVAQKHAAGLPVPAAGGRDVELGPVRGGRTGQRATVKASAAGAVSERTVAVPRAGVAVRAQARRVELAAGGLPTAAAEPKTPPVVSSAGVPQKRRTGAAPGGQAGLSVELAARRAEGNAAKDVAGPAAAASLVGRRVDVRPAEAQASPGLRQVAPRVANAFPAEPGPEWKLIGSETELEQKRARIAPNAADAGAVGLSMLVAAAHSGGRAPVSAAAPSASPVQPAAPDAGPTMPLAGNAGTPSLIRAEAGGGPGSVGLGHQVSGGTVVMATARYEGDWDCDRTALPNLAHQLEQRVGFVVEADSRVVTLDSEDLHDCAFVFLTGHKSFRFTEAEVRNLERYLAGGGALWVNDSTHEGDRSFDEAVRRELARVLPGSKLAPIPMDAPLFSACYDLRRGYKGYRVPPGDKYREDTLHGVQADGRWVVVYGRNDYGDGLEIDPNTHPLMKSLTSLSPQEMQEGSVRMGMNLAFYFLASVRSADEMERLKIADMKRAAASVPEAEERERAGLAGKTFTPLLASVEPVGEWEVMDWSQDQTSLSTAGAQDLPGSLSVHIVHGPDGKNVIGREVAGDLSGHQWLVLEMDSQMSAGARVAVGLSTGEDWAYFESAPKYLRPTENATLAFDLTAATYKSQATNWEYSTQVSSLDEVRAIYVLFYPISSGTVTIREMKLAR